MKKNFILLLFAAAFCPLLSAAAFAYRIADVDVKLRASSGVSYDDNVTYLPEHALNDIIASLTAGFSALYEGKNTVLGVNADVTREMFNKNRSFNNTSEDFTLNLAQEFSKHDRLLITDSFVHAEEPRSWEDIFGATSGRYSYYRNRAGITYSRDITSQFTFIGRYNNQQDFYTLRSTPDSHLDVFGVEGDYFITSSDGIVLAYNFSRRKFIHGPSASINNPMGGIRHYFTKQFYISGMGGLDFINPYSGRKHTKPAYSASLTDELDQNSRVALSYIKQSQAVAYSEDLFDSWQSSLDFTRQLLERLGGALSFFYGEGRYTGVNVKDNFTGASTGFTYDLKDTWQAKLNYSYAVTTSNLHSREYKKNVVSFNLTGKF